MSLKVQNYIKKSSEKKQNLFNAEVISFPNDKRLNISEDFKLNTLSYWKISDKSNEDQLKAITGICFMFGALILIGLYSNFS